MWYLSGATDNEVMTMHAEVKARIKHKMKQHLLSVAHFIDKDSSYRPRMVGTYGI